MTDDYAPPGWRPLTDAQKEILDEMAAEVEAAIIKARYRLRELRKQDRAERARRKRELSGAA